MTSKPTWRSSPAPRTSSIISGSPSTLRWCQVNRLHILQRFHDYLSQVEELPRSAAERWTLHADLLGAAYRDFVVSDARTEKVFRVFRMHEPQRVAIPLEDLLGQIPKSDPPHAAPV